MSYPASSNALRTVMEYANSLNVEGYTIPGSAPYTYQLGHNLVPPMPSGWVVVPTGGANIAPPGAPTAGTPATTTASGHFLTSAGTYQWALTNVTKYGETTPGTAYAPGALAGGVTGVNLTMPTLTGQGSVDAPVLSRRLYRTTNGGATFYFVADIDNTTTEYTDGKPDSDLLVAAPSSNTSGVSASVIVTVNGVTATEVPYGTTPSAGQYTVDYSYSATGGTITHAAADAGASGAVTYRAASLLNAATVNAIINAIKDTATALGTPNAASGAVVLDASSSAAIAGNVTLGRHLISNGTAPTIANGANLGTATLTTPGALNDLYGTVIVNPSGSLTVPTDGELFTVAFAASRGNYVAWAWGNQKSSGDPSRTTDIYCYNPTGTGFSVRSGPGFTITQPLAVNYIVLGG